MRATKNIGWWLLTASLGVHLWFLASGTPEPAVAAAPAPEVTSPAPAPAEPRPRRRAARRPEPPPQLALDTSALLSDLAGATRPRDQIEILERLGITRSPDAVPALAELAEGGEPGVASAATAALGRIGGATAVEVLIGLAEAGPPGIRGVATRALGSTRAPEARAWLLEAARRENAQARDAFTGIGALGDAEAERFLATELWRTHGRFPSEVASALASLETDTARATLGRAARGGPSMQVRAASVRALGSIAGEEERALLLELARSGDPELGPAAVDALAQKPSPEVLTALVELAQDGPREVGSNAVWAISRFPAEDARPALLDLLSEARDELAWVVTSAIAEFGDGEARDALLGLLGGSRAWAQAALQALDRVPFDDAVKDALLRTVDEGSPQLLGVALHTLARRAGDEAVPWLQAASRKGGMQVQHQILYALSTIRGPKAEAWLTELATTGPYPARQQALEAMARRPGPARERALDLMLADLERGGRQWGMGYALAQMHDPRATQALLQAIGKRPAAGATELVRALAMSGDEEAVGQLLEMVRATPSEARKAQLVSGLGGGQDEQTAAFLRELAEQEGALGSQALQALIYSGGGAEERALAQRAAQSTDPQRRTAGLQMLAQTGGDLALEAAASALGDSDASVRSTALSVLQQVGTEAAAEVAAKHYRSATDPWEKSMMLSPMVMSGHPQGIALAKEAVSGSDENLSNQATYALLNDPSGAGIQFLTELAQGEGDLANEVRQTLVSMGHLDAPGNLDGQDGQDGDGAATEIEPSFNFNLGDLRWGLPGLE